MELKTEGEGAYRTAESYAKRNWLWLFFAALGVGVLIGRLWAWTKWPFF